MTLLDWTPAVTTTSLLALMLWLFRNLIQTRLTNSVRHEFDSRLEGIRSEYRIAEYDLRAAIESKAIQIESLRSGALAGIVNREVALSRRQIEAVDQLWSAVTKIASAKWISDMISVLNFDVAAKTAAENPQFRKLIEGLGASFDPDAIKTLDAAKARPFVSPMAWALYSAYAAIIGLAVMRYHVLKSGISETKIIDDKGIEELVRVALPDRAEALVKHGIDAAHFMLGELETRLLEELRRVISGVDSDNESVERAAKILREVDRLAEAPKLKES